MKATKQSSNMTSFHGHSMKATVQQLRQVLGEPAWISSNIEEKVQYDWVMETDAGQVFTVYDWKEYRHFEEDELIEWHIGSHESATSKVAMYELMNELYHLQ